MRSLATDIRRALSLPEEDGECLRECGLLTIEQRREVAAATRGGVENESFTWEETLGRGWIDREDRAWDPTRSLADDESSCYSEASSASDTDTDPDDNSDYYVDEAI